MAKKNVIERIFVAGAATALNYKDKNQNATESETMSHVTKLMKRIIKEIQNDK